MPFKVQYEIFDDKHGAPDYQTYDYTMARIELNDRKRNPRGMLWRLEQTVMPDGALSKAEEYLFLVYRVRKLTIQYRNDMTDKNKKVLLEHVKKLDDWNKTISGHISTHPGYKPADEKSHSFYVIVKAWRDAYYERQHYCKHTTRAGYDHNLFREMTRKIRGFEKKIDEYIKDQLQLI